MTNPTDPSKAFRGSQAYRARHRAQSHDSAHAQSPADLPAIPERELVPRGEVPLITQGEQLIELIGHLREMGSFGYDSEFIGEMTYIPKLCLIQVASRQRVALIDPLAGIDLWPFWELVCDPAVEKIVHAGAQDVEPVIRLTGGQPANLLDTQLAAGMAGMAYPASLGKLVHELVGVKLSKGLTFSHWDNRPLSAMQLRYAADDVRYLPALRHELGVRLEAMGHVGWVREECDAMCDASLYGFDPETHYRRVRGAGSLDAQGLTVLRELTIWRDGAARAHDLPPRAFLRDEILVDLSRQPVKVVEKLTRVRGLPKPIELAHGAEIVAATLRALALPAAARPLPRHTEESPIARFRADSLWAAVQVICSGQGIEPNLVTDHQEIEELCRGLNKPQTFAEHRLFQGWRNQAVGNAVRQMIQNQDEIAFRWQQGRLHTEHRGDSSKKPTP